MNANAFLPGRKFTLVMGIVAGFFLGAIHAGEKDDDPLGRPASGLLALTKAYAPDQGAFETAWKNQLSLVNGLKGAREMKNSPLSSLTPPPSIAYLAGENHHRAVCFIYDHQNYLAIVRFKDPAKRDLAIYLDFPYEKKGVPMEQLTQILENLPYCTDTTRQNKDYPLTADGKVDPAVFMRDFFSVLVSVY